MNKDVLKGNWKQLKGEVKKQWGKLTDDDLAKIEGNFDELVGTVQERYGYERAQAEREVEDYLERIESDIA
ncbi:MAG: CsbD family protein [Anaerolineales bacterium]